jgi:hypothetical protein
VRKTRWAAPSEMGLLSLLWWRPERLIQGVLFSAPLFSVSTMVLWHESVIHGIHHPLLASIDAFIAY